MNQRTMRGTTLRAAARAGAEALDRWAPTRHLTRALDAALVGAALRRLARQPGVARAFARGSHGRGDHVPLASDLDLAIVLREPGRRPSFSPVLGVIEALERVRGWNPLVRDSWQLLVGDTEWPLLARHAGVVRLDEWRDVDGRPPDCAADAGDERLALAAQWNRLHLWTDSALRHVTGPAPDADTGAALAFAAAEKKALWLAAPLTGMPSPRYRRPPPRTPAEARRRAAALLAVLEESARRVAARLGLAAPALPPAAMPRDEAERATAAALARALTGDVAPACAVLHSGMIAVVLAEPPGTPRRQVELAEALARAAGATGKRLFAYSPLTLALAPIYEPARVLAIDAGADASRAAADRATGEAERGLPAPLLLREQLLYEALLVGADVRATAARAAGDPGLAYTSKRLARMLVFFTTGDLVRDGNAALEAARGLEVEVARALDPEPSSRQDRFALNVALLVALVERLERGER